MKQSKQQAKQRGFDESPLCVASECSPDDPEPSRRVSFKHAASWRYFFLSLHSDRVL
jgi:hypothetical protein